jgi:hypothetical protein
MFLLDGDGPPWPAYIATLSLQGLLSMGKAALLLRENEQSEARAGRVSSSCAHKDRTKQILIAGALWLTHRRDDR